MEPPGLQTLERQTRANLDCTGAIGLRRNGSESGIDCRGIRRGKRRVIQQIENFEANLQLGGFRWLEIFNGGAIKLIDAVLPQISECGSESSQVVLQLLGGIGYELSGVEGH